MLRKFFSRSIRKYIPRMRGLIHVGAHYGEEIERYKEAGIRDVLLFEPLAEPFRILQSIGYGTAVKKALGNTCGKMNMYVSTKHDASSSLLRPKLHLQQYPDMQFDALETVDVITLDGYIDENNLVGMYNTLNIDVQGYELEVFKGARNTLCFDIDYILCEINKDELYEGCSLIGEVDSYLRNLKFTRVDTIWKEVLWGEALYVKTNKILVNCDAI